MNTFPATQLLITIAFGVAVLATIVGGLIAVLTRRLIRSVCGLAICCLGLAGIYYFLDSPFLALMEILIYVGAVCITIVFAVMLAEPDEASESVRVRRSRWAWGAGALLVSGGVFWGLAWLSLSHPWRPPSTPTKTGSLWDVGVALLTTYSLAFEVISLVLLVAILGALVVAHHGRSRT